MPRRQHFVLTPIKQFDPAAPFRWDWFGDCLPRPDGTIAQITGRRESEAIIRRLCRQAYDDWMWADATIAYHLTKRLYEQLTGELNPDAAMAATFEREYSRPNPWGRVEVGQGAIDKLRFSAIECGQG